MDELVGTADNDTFRGFLEGTDDTLTTFDTIEGGAGTDTLNLLMEGAGPYDIPAGVEISGVEIINLVSDGTAALENDGATGLDATVFEGAEQVWLANAINAAGAVLAGEGQTIGFRNVDATATVTVASDVDSASIALDRVADKSAVSVDETTTGDLETVSVSGSLAAGADELTIEDVTKTAETLNLNLTTKAVDLTLTTFDSLVTLDASASTGGIKVDLSGNADLEAASFGSGVDDVTIGGQKGLVVNAGAGADTISFDGSGEGQQIVGGAGGDTFVLTAAATNISETDDFADLVTTIDFKSPDVIDLSGTGFVALNDAQADAVAAAGTFADAFAIATGFQAETAFLFEGSTYIVNDADNSSSFTDGDGVIELVGFTGNLVDGTNLIA
ncbi:hypothetical protein HNR26_004617 [Rhizobium rosettiformans]|uniref:Calcium-binding protein n=2 Tax=Rhizobium rosettiformans TaxID=1368430 RepID=A0A4S8PK31_9HYPH|nr:hypothetical protein [Rhizobium rosettiformans]MBB5278516.1 hypothetical protein [Rhizobium rosettiformans]THV31068.1 hypothetical protein FAA86_22430 [Rhizobium rosettiformans W3]